MSSQSAQDALTIQKRVRELQEKLHHDVATTNSMHNRQKNDVLAARDAHVQQLIADGVLPRHFWADCLVAALQCPDATSVDGGDEAGKAQSFLGAYDAELLRGYLRGMQLRYTASGYRLSLQFAPNPYFAETEVWAECADDDDSDANDAEGGTDDAKGGKPHGGDDAATTAAAAAHDADETARTSGDRGKSASGSDDDDDDDDSSADFDQHWQFSGVTWRDGYGPNDDDDDDDKNNDDEAGEGDKEAGGATRPGSKRERSTDATRRADEAKANKHDDAAASASAPRRGPSMLEAFSVMPPHPEADDELADEDEDVLGDLIDAWEAEMEDRATLMQLIAQDVLHDPLKWWKDAMATVGDGGNDASGTAST